MSYRELLLGAGTNRTKKMHPDCDHGEWTNLTTVDRIREYEPDLLWDLRSHHSLPFASDSFDEIHAYEVLEHLGHQGDWRTLARQFNDYWRLLKPGGYFCATVPCHRSIWAWGDPDHKRVITAGTLAFLSQPNFGVGGIGMTPMAEYGGYVGDFELTLIGHTAEGDHEVCSLVFILRAVKPARSRS